MNTEERFWSKVSKTEMCWEWTASLFKNGYGQFWANSRKYYAHRYSYELLTGPLKSDLCIDHLCRNRACVNPQHLEQVTMRTNLLRGESPSAKQARQTHCHRGHEFNEINTWREHNGKRHCKRCWAITKRLQRLK